MVSIPFLVLAGGLRAGWLGCLNQWFAAIIAMIGAGNFPAIQDRDRVAFAVALVDAEARYWRLKAGFGAAWAMQGGVKNCGAWSVHAVLPFSEHHWAAGCSAAQVPK
jgi:hypothetical protein